MTPARRELRTPYADPMAKRYALVGGIAVAVLWLNLSERTVGAWAFAAPLVAGAGIAFRWASAPVFVILATAIALMIAHQESRFLRGDDLASDAVLCAAMVTYVLAQCRITALSQTMFPPDHRPPLAPGRSRRAGLPGWIEFLLALTVAPYIIYLFTRKRPPSPKPEPRDGGKADRDELFWAVFTIALVTCGTLTLWSLTDNSQPPFRIIPMQWRLGVTLWVILAMILLARVIVGVRAARNMTAVEARLFLVDTLWRETRREQHRLAHWTAARRATTPAKETP